MIEEKMFDALFHKAKEYPYSSMNYIEYEDCKNADVLYDSDGLILLRDGSKTPAMLHFATNAFDSIIEKIAGMPGGLRLHFVPRPFSKQLEALGFTEWGEYVDFWNLDLTSTAARLGESGQAEYLTKNECSEASAVSRRCRLQSRGFEGESAEWFAEWLNKDSVIIQRKGTAITGFCCVSIYNEGTTLWIREIAVDPVHQGTGIGKKLMEQAIRHGASRGAVKGFLAADVLNRHAIRLYEKYDFHGKDTDSELQMIRE